MTVIGAGGSSILAAYVNCMLPSNVNFFVSCLEIFRSVISIEFAFELDPKCLLHSC